MGFKDPKHYTKKPFDPAKNLPATVSRKSTPPYPMGTQTHSSPLHHFLSPTAAIKIAPCATQVSTTQWSFVLHLLLSSASHPKNSPSLPQSQSLSSS